MPSERVETRNRPAHQVQTPAVEVAASPDADGQAQTKSEAAPAAGAGKRTGRLLVYGVIGAAGVALAVYFGVPWARHYFSHEATDDAYVNSYVTYPSPRVAGYVVKVFVEDNDYVEAGQLLVQLDREPYEIVCQEKKAAYERAKMKIDQEIAALDAAEAEVEQARNQVRSGIAGVQVALANVNLQKANLELAKKEHNRYAELAPGGAASKETLDQKKAKYDVVKEQLAASVETVKQAYALLGLPPDPSDLVASTSVEAMMARVPVILKDVESLVERVPSVRMAQAGARQMRAALGGAAFDPREPYRHPDVLKAKRELDQAELNLRYTEIRSAITGYVSNRAVNEGNQVQVGQMLMAIRPLQDVWIDANFKETQLERLRIGQPVDIYVDAYPSRVFKGRIAGFNAGTGAAMSLLPPQNATGNFVKVVQRLPVRIELTEPPPREAPLYVGLSVYPEVDFNATPTGPHAGERLLGKRKISKISN